MKIIGYARCKGAKCRANPFDFGAAKRRRVSLGNPGAVYNRDFNSENIELRV